jgi:hypothetical protein
VVFSSSNKTDRHYVTEILLKVALNNIKQTNKQTNNKQGIGSDYPQTVALV